MINRQILGSAASYQSGFTLLEVLIAMLVLAVGLFALAALQVFSMRTTGSAYQRSVATWTAQDILERIRSNSGELANYSSDFSEYITSQENLTKDCEGVGLVCSAADLKTYDMETWKISLANELPGGEGKVTVDQTVPDFPVVVVTVRWKDLDSKGRQIGITDFVFKTLL